MDAAQDNVKRDSDSLKRTRDSLDPAPEHDDDQVLKVTVSEPRKDNVAKEIGIQANDYEIERGSSHLPARKRYIPLKFSDYRVFDTTQNYVKTTLKKELEDEAEDGDTTFEPGKSQERKQHKNQKRRGGPKKNARTPTSEADGPNSQNEEVSTSGKAAIIKVAGGFKCSLCGHVFTLRGNAKSHLITHTDKRPFSCDFEGCGKSMRTKEALRRHQLSHLGIKMYECTICERKLSTNVSLQEHMAVHSGEKSLVCPVCGRKFRQRAVLKRHIVTHSAEKPHACSVCGKTFSMKAYVQSHMKTHTGERPFTCDICSKSFAHASDLKRHKIIHSGEKPYACSICPMRYNDVSSRKRHEREHQTGQQFLCSMCNQHFSRAGHLRTHLARVHNMGPNSLYEVHAVEKPDNWTPGTQQAKFVSLLPNTHQADFVDQSGQAEKESEAVLNSPTSHHSHAVQLLVESTDSSSTYKLSSDNNPTSGQDITTKTEESIELSVLDPALERLDMLQPGYTYKIIDHPNSSNVLEFRLEEAVNVIPQEGLTTSANSVPDETSLTLIKKMGDGTMMVIQETPKQEINIEEEQNQQQNQCSVIESVSVANDPKLVHKSLNKNVCQPSLQSSSGSSQIEEINNKNDVREGTMPGETDHNDVLESFEQGIPDVKVIAMNTLKPFSDKSLDYISRPDFDSQDYYNWLSTFTEDCKLLPLPLEKEIFQKISQVQKTLADFMAAPSGVITDKNNFKVLMSITKDLSDIIGNHLMLMYQNLS